LLKCVPATLGGRPVMAWITLPFQFSFFGEKEVPSNPKNRISINMEIRNVYLDGDKTCQPKLEEVCVNFDQMAMMLGEGRIPTMKEKERKHKVAIRVDTDGSVRMVLISPNLWDPFEEQLKRYLGALRFRPVEQCGYNLEMPQDVELMMTLTKMP
jgi:hypothetical protein